MRLTSKGQVTIPIEIRERLGLQAGTELQFAIDGDSVRITKAREAEERGKTLIARLRGSGTTSMTTDEILALTRE